MASPVTHFDIYGRNATQLRDFYTKVFGRSTRTTR